MTLQRFFPNGKKTQGFEAYNSTGEAKFKANTLYELRESLLCADEERRYYARCSYPHYIVIDEQ